MQIFPTYHVQANTYKLWTCSYSIKKVLVRQKIMTVGEVSENPSSNAVTRPTVPQSRDEDIEGMLRLYGIFTAFGVGIFHLRQIN